MSIEHLRQLTDAYFNNCNSADAFVSIASTRDTEKDKNNIKEKDMDLPLDTTKTLSKDYCLLPCENNISSYKLYKIPVSRDKVAIVGIRGV